MGKILGVKLEAQYMPVLLVKEVEQRVQTTVLWGESLLFSATGLTPTEFFLTLMRQWVNGVVTWGELEEIPQNTQNYTRLRLPRPDPLPATVETAIKLADVGFNPLIGCWAEFAAATYAFPMFLTAGRFIPKGV